MKQQAWALTGRVLYWALLPLIALFCLVSKPRARVLLVHNDSVLLVQNWLGAGGWTLPGGGLNTNETAVTAAVREIHEELGLTLKDTQLQAFGSHTSVESYVLIARYELFATELFKKPALVVEEREIVGVKWVPIHAIETGEIRVSNTALQSVRAWSKANTLVS